jgi:hypothetical protein
MAAHNAIPKQIVSVPTAVQPADSPIQDTAKEPQKPGSNGWSPYEVWRTRVLAGPANGTRSSRGNP